MLGAIKEKTAPDKIKQEKILFNTVVGKTDWKLHTHPQKRMEIFKSCVGGEVVGLTQSKSKHQFIIRTVSKAGIEGTY